MTAVPSLPTPLPAPDGAAVLQRVEDFVGRFVAFPSEGARVAVALWAAHAHLVDAFDSSPRLALLSPEPGSGKSRTLEVLDALTPTPLHSLSASPAAIFRVIAAGRPTLLFDEVDAIFGKRGKSDENEDLRALLNAGHRAGATIPRCVGPTHKVVGFPVFAAVALAGLGDLPDTLMSRSVIVRMRRRAPGERIEPFRMRTHPHEGHAIRDELAGWAATVRDEVAEAWPTLPPGVEDRPADVWEPLLAIAEAAGGPWPELGRAACSELVAVASEADVSLGVRLLTDIHHVFSSAGMPDSMPTATVLERLHALDEAPWENLRGAPLAAHGLSRLLTDYGIRSSKIWTGDKALQGYRREDLWDAWARYVASDPSEAAEETTDS